MSINFSINILSPSFERDPLQYELVCLFKRRKVMARALRVSVMCTPPVFDLSVSRDSVVLVSTCGQIDNYEIIFHHPIIKLSAPQETTFWKYPKRLKFLQILRGFL